MRTLSVPESCRVRLRFGAAVVLVCLGHGLALPPAAANWEFLGLQGQHIEQLSSNGDVVFAVVREGSFWERSLWRIPIDDPSAAQKVWDAAVASAWTVACHPLEPDTVYLGLAGMFEPVPEPIVQRSVDGGVTFSPFDSGICPQEGGMRVLSASATSPALLAAAPDGSPHVSDSASATWTPGIDPEGCVPCGTICSWRFAIARGVSQPSVLWMNVETLGMGGLLYRSEDGGGSWDEVMETLLFAWHSVLIDPGNAERVYVGSRGSARRTVDGGEAWEEMPLPRGAEGLAIDVTDPSILYAASYFPPDDPYVSWSPAYGVVWNDVDVTGLPANEDQSAFAADPVRQGLLFVGFPAAGIYMNQISVAPLDVDDPQAVSAKRQLAVSPNPFERSTTLHLGELVGRFGEASVWIFDPAGRLVRELDVLSVSGEQLTIRWDGHDGFGAVLPPGVYFARTALGASVRLVKLR